MFCCTSISEDFPDDYLRMTEDDERARNSSLDYSTYIFVTVFLVTYMPHWT
jgi:hypothetical protein